MTKKTFQDRPLVSVILAAFNEVSHIQKCMVSLLEQEASYFDLEILAVDGVSTDGTRECLEEMAAADPRVRVLVNEKRKAPFAFNLGLREARGEYVCIFGGHAVYNKDYISVCLSELVSRNAVACAGRVLTQASSSNLEARLIAQAIAHPFGSSQKSFRTQPEGFADALSYIVIRKKPLMDIGGYSEVLFRNQDNDVYQKLRAQGHRLFCTWKTECVYHPKETIRDLFVYAYRNGFWNVISFKENSASMAGRHFIPLLFVASLLAASLIAASRVFLPVSFREFAPLSLAALLLLHLSIGTIAALQIALREKCFEALYLPVIFIGFHFAYGLGSLLALVTRGKALAFSPEVSIDAQVRPHGESPQSS